MKINYANTSNGSGFTLLELMVVVAVIAVMLMAGGASFRTSLERNQQKSTVNSVLDMLSYARAEAVIRAEPVAACPSTNGSSCSGAAWEDGWVVFVDSGVGAGGSVSDGIRNGGEELLRVASAAPDGMSVRTVNFASTSSVLFRDDGRLSQNDSGTFVICSALGVTEAAGVVVGVSGQSRLTVDADSDNVEEDDEGDAVSCP